MPCADAIVAAVAHRHYHELDVAQIVAKVTPGGCFVDVTCGFDPRRWARQD